MPVVKVDVPTNDQTRWRDANHHVDALAPAACGEVSMQDTR